MNGIGSDISSSGQKRENAETFLVQFKGHVELPLSRTFEDLLSEDERETWYKILPQRGQKNLIWAVFFQM
jgi:hypothetical protein